MPWLDIVWSWVLVFLILASLPAVAWLIRVLRFLVLRVRLMVELALMGAKPLRPLAWLIGWRTACDYLLDLRDPDSGLVTHTLAIQLIPTVLGGTEYCVENIENWQRQRTILFPMSLGTLPMNLGYRRLRRRNRERIFRRVPRDAVRVYLFHPHPYALTLRLRGQKRRRSHPGENTLPVPLWREDVLLLDLQSLRLLASGETAVRRQILERER